MSIFRKFLTQLSCRVVAVQRSRYKSELECCINQLVEFNFCINYFSVERDLSSYSASGEFALNSCFSNSMSMWEQATKELFAALCLRCLSLPCIDCLDHTLR
jgi:hypothetical protein